MIDLIVKQSWLEKSSEAALEEFKSALVTLLNSFPEDRHTENRWTMTKISEGDEATLVYDERPLLSLKIEDAALSVRSSNDMVMRYDDVIYAIRYVASQLMLAVYSNAHNGTRLPQSPAISLDHTLFERDKDMREFFEKSDFIPRFAITDFQDLDDGRRMLGIYQPFYAESKLDGSIHILNDKMLAYVSKKDNQRLSQEFSYKVADSMQDFARKYDLALVPTSFYQSYGLPTKIINETYFDAFHINRKVFIDPYVWDFDDEHDYRFYKNVETGMHLMDKVRSGENLDDAIRRTLKEELKVADNYVGARIWGIEFDRDKEGILTPRLKISVYVNGMTERHRSQDHDWVSLT
jgi:hypothetical protein